MEPQQKIKFMTKKHFNLVKDKYKKIDEKVSEALSDKSVSNDTLIALKLESGSAYSVVSVKIIQDKSEEAILNLMAKGF